MKITEKATFPRPDFIRENYMSLNGEWEFALDEWTDYDLKIQVPFPYQSPASGVNKPQEYHPVVRYRRTFCVQPDGRTVLLHFGAVDHDAEVYLNGQLLGVHSGGYTPFCFDVTDLLRNGENELTVTARDETRMDQVRGKQYWGVEGFTGCHYVAVTGIWQEVWLEFTAPDRIEAVRYTSDFDRSAVLADITLNRPAHGKLSLQVEKDGEAVQKIELTVNGRYAHAIIRFEECSIEDNFKLNWSPANPNLFDVTVTLQTENGTDTVETYFGLRKISVSGDRIFLNNSQYYLRMILDQGYWKEGIYRPAEDDGFRRDVELTLALGFNSARKHQKIEDPKYYYWADRLGLLVWGELPSFYSFTENACTDAENTMREFIQRDFNHPCIMAWVPFNETWGLRKLLGDPRQANFARELYYQCKRFDPARLVSTNDGWENVYPTDIVGVHDYRGLDEGLSRYYADTSFFKTGSGRTGHPYTMPGETYGGQPVLFTEFGGRRFEDADAFLKATQKDMTYLLQTPTFCGYCYTQLTDTFQEANGLLDMDRNPKAEIETLKGLFGKNGQRYGTGSGELQ